MSSGRGRRDELALMSAVNSIIDNGYQNVAVLALRLALTIFVMNEQRPWLSVNTSAIRDESPYFTVLMTMPLNVSFMPLLIL